MISLDVSLQNETKGDNFISDIQSKLNDSKWYWFFLSIFLAQIWVIFLTFYNSRVTGLIMTAVINKFVKLGHIKLGKKIYNTYSRSDHLCRQYSWACMCVHSVLHYREGRTTFPLQLTPLSCKFTHTLRNDCKMSC